MATTLGLAAVALRNDPAMRPLSPADVSAGLPAAAAASALLGQGGAAALLVLLFLAVTSATSAELIAVSSILTYDVYKVSGGSFLSFASSHVDRLAAVYQPRSERGADPANGTCDGEWSNTAVMTTIWNLCSVSLSCLLGGVFRALHGACRNHLLFHRGIHGVVVCTSSLRYQLSVRLVPHA